MHAQIIVTALVSALGALLDVMVLFAFYFAIFGEPCCWPGRVPLGCLIKQGQPRVLAASLLASVRACVHACIHARMCVYVCVCVW